MEISTLVQALKVVVAASVIFVWFIRYDNIVAEFKHYAYPDWLRDLTGILKISFVVMIQSSDSQLSQVGCLGVAALMLAAVGTHIKVKNPLPKMLPSLSLLAISLFLFLSE